MNLYAWWCIADREIDEPDCFIVPSYALKDRETPTLMTKAQIEKAVGLQRQFPDTIIIFSTGDTQGLGIPDSAVMAAYARELGAPQSSIVEEGESKNSAENLLFSQDIMQDKGVRRPILVLYDLHARRVLAIARKMGWQDIGWVSVTSPGEGAEGIKWLRTFSRPAILLYELVGMVYSKLMGWI